MARLVRAYEEKLRRGAPFYMDAFELADIVEYYMDHDLYYDAEACLRFALQLHPDDEDLLLQQAYFLKTSGKWDDALSMLRAHTDISHRGMAIFMIEYWLAHADTRKAWDEVRSLMLDDYYSGETSEILQEIAEIYFEYGFYQHAAELTQSLDSLARISGGDPDEPDIKGISIPTLYRDYNRTLLYRGAAYLQLHDVRFGTMLLNRLIDGNPYDATLWMELAAGYHANHRYEDCIDAADYALAIEPGNRHALRLRLTSLHSLRRMEEAVEACEAYLSVDAQNISVMQIKAESLFALGRYEESLALGRSAYAISAPDSIERPRILSNIFFCLIALERYEELLLLFTSAVTFCNLVAVGIRVADRLFRAENYTMAVEVLHLAVYQDAAQPEERMAIFRLLHKYVAPHFAQRLWHELSRETYLADADHRGDEAPYRAWAFRGMHEPFLAYFDEACAAAPGLTHMLFEDLFPGMSLPEMRGRLAAEDESFRHG